MTSPIVLVNGSLLPTSGTGGINVTGGSTVTVSLNDTTGVTSWSLVCTNTDDKTTAPTITGTGLTGRTFTAPSVVAGRGASLQFTSTVNNGVDSNGVVQSSYTLTFGVFVLGFSGIRLFFPGETNESNVTYGCVSDFNALVTSPIVTGPTGGIGIQGYNAFSTTYGFTQPAVNSSIAIQIPSGYWVQPGQYVFIPSGGYYRVASGFRPHVQPSKPRAIGS